MSSYLIDQIGGQSNITLLPCSEIVEAIGDTNLQQLVIQKPG
jgi:thioredoxin reductase (NADPH)